VEREGGMEGGREGGREGMHTLVHPSKGLVRVLTSRRSYALSL